MPLDAKMQKVATATTAAVGSTNKVTALVSGTMDQLFAELGKTGAMTPNMKVKYELMRANAITNIATLQTAVGL